MKLVGVLVMVTCLALLQGGLASEPSTKKTKRALSFTATWEASGTPFDGEPVFDVTVLGEVLSVNKTIGSQGTTAQFSIDNNGALTADGTQLCFLSDEGVLIIADPTKFSPPGPSCSSGDSFGLYRNAYLTWGSSHDTWCIVSGGSNVAAGFGLVSWVPGLPVYEVHPTGCAYRGRILLSGRTPNPTPTIATLRADASAVQSAAAAFSSAMNKYVNTGSASDGAAAQNEYIELQDLLETASEDAEILNELGESIPDTAVDAYALSSTSRTFTVSQILQYPSFILAISGTLVELAANFLSAANSPQPSTPTPSPAPPTTTSACPSCDCRVTTLNLVDPDDASLSLTDSLAAYTSYTPTPSPTPSYPLPSQDYSFTYTYTSSTAAARRWVGASPDSEPTSIPRVPRGPEVYNEFMDEGFRVRNITDDDDDEIEATFPELYTACSVSYDNNNYPSTSQDDPPPAGSAQTIPQIAKWWDWQLSGNAANPICPWTIVLAANRFTGNNYATEHIYEKHLIATYLRWLSGYYNVPCTTINSLNQRSTTANSPFAQSAPYQLLALALSDNTRVQEFHILRAEVNRRKTTILSTSPELSGVPSINANWPWANQLLKIRHVTMAFAYMNENSVLGVFQTVNTRMKDIYTDLDQDPFYPTPVAGGNAACTGWLQCYNTWIYHFFAYKQYKMEEYIMSAVSTLRTTIQNDPSLTQADLTYIMQFIQTQSQPLTGGLLSLAAMRFRQEYFNLS